ncbi:hypothetical protein NC652_000026 [Populus alba x Populus x berolinensis]|nr:hypothetical protein NC652_000026 [Populus alba x Populus x berolinensis]
MQYAAEITVLSADLRVDLGFSSGLTQDPIPLNQSSKWADSSFSASSLDTQLKVLAQ